MLDSTQRDPAETTLELHSNVKITLLPVFLVIVTLWCSGCSRKKNHSRCIGNLEQMGVALFMYSGDYSGLFPNELSNLAEKDYLSPGKVYQCPEDGKNKIPSTSTDISNGKCSYRYVGAGLRDDNSDSSSTPVAYCDCGKHGEHGVPTLFIDGHVESLPGIKHLKDNAKEKGNRVLIVQIEKLRSKSYGFINFKKALKKGGQLSITIAEIRENDRSFEQDYTIAKDGMYFTTGALINYISDYGWKFHSRDFGGILFIRDQ